MVAEEKNAERKAERRKEDSCRRHIVYHAYRMALRALSCIGYTDGSRVTRYLSHVWSYFLGGILPAPLLVDLRTSFSTNPSLCLSFQLQQDLSTFQSIQITKYKLEKTIFIIMRKWYRTFCKIYIVVLTVTSMIKIVKLYNLYIVFYFGYYDFINKLLKL